MGEGRDTVGEMWGGGGRNMRDAAGRSEGYVIFCSKTSMVYTGDKERSIIYAGERGEFHMCWKKREV